jgi:hypothetical protein
LVAGALVLSGGASATLSCADAPSGSAPPPPAEPPPTQFEPAPAALRRLLAPQYVNSVRVLLGEQAASAAKPPLDASVSGLLAIGSAEIATPPASVAAYDDSAREVARAAIEGGALAPYMDCTPAAADDAACLEELVRRFGGMAFRRPLSDVEVARYVGVGLAGAIERGNFEGALEFALRGMLQSPHFLYIVEIGEVSGSVRTLTPREVATRLSFFLLDATPEPELLDAADRGELADEAGLQKVALQLFERGQAKDTLARLYFELFRLTDLSAQPKDATVFPDWSPELARSMAGETRRLLDHLVWEEDSDFRRLFDADFTFVDQRLASFYGMAAVSGAGFEQRATAGTQGRAGILGHASILSSTSAALLTSPTNRGKFVREVLLCQTIPPPPPTVSNVLPDQEPGAVATMRDRLASHAADPACSGCHALMDPIGFALELYDATGAHRTLDQGLPIDAQSEAEDLGEFASAADLGKILAEAEDTPRCALRHTWRNAFGRVETEGEEPLVAELEAAFAASGYRMKDLLLRIVLSPAFRTIGEPQ